MEFIRSKKQVVKLNSHLAQYLRNRNENKPVFLYISPMHKENAPVSFPTCNATIVTRDRIEIQKMSCSNDLIEIQKKSISFKKKKKTL